MFSETKSSKFLNTTSNLKSKAMLSTSECEDQVIPFINVNIFV